MTMMDVQGCLDCIREHFYKSDSHHQRYRLPPEAYVLHQDLQYKICLAWDRFEQSKSPTLTPREGILLAEVWCLSNLEKDPLEQNPGWVPDCLWCGAPLADHDDHPENNAQNNPPDRWVCRDGRIYQPKLYPEQQR